jgi:hypothetical protein
MWIASDHYLQQRSKVFSFGDCDCPVGKIEISQMIGKANSDRIFTFCDRHRVGSPVNRFSPLNGITNTKATHKIGSLTNQLRSSANCPVINCSPWVANQICPVLLSNNDERIFKVNAQLGGTCLGFFPCCLECCLPDPPCSIRHFHSVSISRGQICIRIGCLMSSEQSGTGKIGLFMV